MLTKTGEVGGMTRAGYKKLGREACPLSPVQLSRITPVVFPVTKRRRRAMIVSVIGRSKSLKITCSLINLFVQASIRAQQHTIVQLLFKKLQPGIGKFDDVHVNVYLFE